MAEDWRRQFIGLQRVGAQTEHTVNYPTRGILEIQVSPIVREKEGKGES